MATILVQIFGLAFWILVGRKYQVLVLIVCRKYDNPNMEMNGRLPP